ncbi:mechanosensitive ion channel family protein [Kiritimatiella glycovorans]|uniref:MscS family inner membrane protein YnaI n=1 Tax=Kiritimatiella glycovorans TaxID=1307763 RepID=A0A0G3EK02_9BACT|nr:mechanosensitive ion channel family protein [Kiritimatiella glycovorans]AKJ65120.1 MscS family inner membrane protein YnaI [Kiritimatiella glycovorans]
MTPLLAVSLNTEHWIGATLTLLIGLGITGGLHYLLRRRFDQLAGAEEASARRTAWRAVFEIAFPLAYFSVVSIAVRALEPGPSVIRTLEVAAAALLTFLAIRFILMALQIAMEKFYVGKGKLTREMTSGLMLIARILVWVFGILFLLDNLGFQVSSLVAGLGIGGVALALSVQTVLGDLLSYYAILLDRPFKLGDFLIIGDLLGTVEHIGIKTTRIRSLSGEELIFSNTDLLNSRVRNYMTMQRRRVVFKLGVTYDTPAEKLEKIPGMIESIIRDQQDTQFDRCHFSAYGDFNLIVETVYYVIGADYVKYMDLQQAINLRIKRAFEAEGIEFAFPTQTIHLRNESELTEGGS